MSGIQGGLCGACGAAVGVDLVCSQCASLSGVKPEPAQVSTDVVGRARALLAGVSPGPWWWNGGGGDGDDEELFSEPDGATVVRARAAHDGTGMLLMSQQDAGFIAGARVLVPELVAEVEQLRAMLLRGRLEVSVLTECVDPETRAAIFNEGYDEAMRQQTGGAEHRAWLVRTADEIVRNAWHAPVPVPSSVVAGLVADAVLSEIDFDQAVAEDNR